MTLFLWNIVKTAFVKAWLPSFKPIVGTSVTGKYLIRQMVFIETIHMTIKLMSCRLYLLNQGKSMIETLKKCSCSKGRRQIHLSIGTLRINKVSKQTFMKSFPGQLVAKLKCNSFEKSLKATTRMDLSKRKLDTWYVTEHLNLSYRSAICPIHTWALILT